MADIGLDRTDVARAGTGLLGNLESLSQTFDFDRVAQRRAGSVRLDVADLRRVDLGDRVRLGDDVGLAGRGRGGVGHLRGAVVVQRRSADHGVDSVTVVHGILQRLEHHHTHAAAENRAVGARIERPAMAGRRHHRAWGVPIPDVMRDAQRCAAGQRHLTLAVQDALAGQVHRDQRRRAGRLHRECGPAQIQRIRQLGGQVVLVVLQRQVDHVEGNALSHNHIRVIVGHDVVQQISAGGAGRVHADRALDLGGVVAGVLDRVERGLQEQPVLRIGRARYLRSEAEEVGVELVDAVHQRGAPHVGVIRQRLLGDALGQQVIFGQRDDRLLAAAQVVPECRQRVGAGQPGRHADHRDRVGRQFAVAGHTRSPTFRLAAAR